MRSLGLQDSLTCEGVLQSARSIEAAFAPPMPPIPGTPAAAAATAADAAGAARRAAVSRSRKLLNFVDHRADQLLLASGESGRWFVDPRASGAAGGAGNGGGENGNGNSNGHGHGKGGAGGEGDEEYVSSSGSESNYEDECSEDDERSDVERRTQGREDKIAAAAERRERRRERHERDKMRAAAAAAAMRLPPPNDFVEELASIAWLPVHGKAPNDLLPWKVCKTVVFLPAVAISCLFLCVIHRCFFFFGVL